MVMWRMDDNGNIINIVDGNKIKAVKCREIFKVRLYQTHRHVDLKMFKTLSDAKKYIAKLFIQLNDGVIIK